MLNCISAMVDKTKRAITILQQRGVESTTVHGSTFQQQQDASFNEIKRQTEEKVAEFRRNAEDAVNQVKRQAVIEIQRAVAASENRAVELMAQERIKMEKMFAGKVFFVSKLFFFYYCKSWIDFHYYHLSVSF